MRKIDFSDPHDWDNHREREYIIRDIIQADAFCKECEESKQGYAEEDEVTPNALTSIARSLITLNELILRGYTSG
jgi:hypothetical protein